MSLNHGIEASATSRSTVFAIDHTAPIATIPGATVLLLPLLLPPYPFRSPSFPPKEGLSQGT